MQDPGMQEDEPAESCGRAVRAGKTLRIEKEGKGTHVNLLVGGKRKRNTGPDSSQLIVPVPGARKSALDGKEKHTHWSVRLWGRSHGGFSKETSSELEPVTRP